MCTKLTLNNNVKFVHTKCKNKKRNKMCLKTNSQIAFYYSFSSRTQRISSVFFLVQTWKQKYNLIRHIWLRVTRLLRPIGQYQVIASSASVYLCFAHHCWGLTNSRHIHYVHTCSANWLIRSKQNISDWSS